MKQRLWMFISTLALILPLLAACGGDTATTAPAPTTGGTTGTTAPATGTDTTTAPAGTATTTGGTTGTTAPAAGGELTKDKAPAVPAAADAKQYSGQTLTYYGGSVGSDAELDQVLAKQFTADTGINVNIIPKPQDPTENYATYQRLFQAQSADIDVMMLDVIWPGAFAPHLLDLTPKLGEAAKAHAEGIVQNNTIDGKLVAMPWFGDYGILYYRTDLLQKYGFSAPPKTWDELTTMAQKIQDGEKAANPNFVGYVFQGAAYEGLTCNALEWQASSGGGLIIEDGKVTVNNPSTVKALNRAASWVGTISPKDVNTFKEEEARNLFQAGNAAFMRNWPYAYALGKTADASGTIPVVADKFDVAPLPHDEGAESVGTVGGWQLGVSRYSKSPDAAVEFVRYMTSPEVQTWRGVVGGYVPTILEVVSDPRVTAEQPYLAKPEIANVVRAARPSAAAGENYNEVSTLYFQSVNEIMLGAKAEDVLPDLQEQLEDLVQ